MVINRPEIVIYTQEADEDFLREVCAGIEEEGVPCQTSERSGDVDELAFLAAGDSVLGVGIGMVRDHLALQMAHLPRGKNVFELKSPRFWQCRNLGANSARAVKKLPFKSIYLEGEALEDSQL
ncbi:MAG: glycerol dehydratase reactivase beta/small subunit family protein [Eubacteriales bacterium]|nr:glycerol dehydratase reactivase beta/small subunit family protein [Eubacteriales bacterium]